MKGPLVRFGCGCIGIPWSSATCEAIVFLACDGHVVESRGLITSSFVSFSAENIQSAVELDLFSTREIFQRMGPILALGNIALEEREFTRRRLILLRESTDTNGLRARLRSIERALERRRQEESVEPSE